MMHACLLTIAILSANPDHWSARAEMYAERGEWIAAVDNADEAVRLDLYNPQRYIDRARIKMRADRWLDAVDDLNVAEERWRRIGYRSMVPFFLRGEIYRILGTQELNLEQTSTELAQCASSRQNENAEQDLEKKRERLVGLQSRLLGIHEGLTARSNQLNRAIREYSMAIGRLPASAQPAKRRESAKQQLEEITALLQEAEREISEVSAVLEPDAALPPPLSEGEAKSADPPRLQP